MLDQVARRLTQNKQIVIIIDGLDHLTLSQTDAQSLSWLPAEWPHHVHAVFTTDTNDGLSMRSLYNHLRYCVRNKVPTQQPILLGPFYGAIAVPSVTRCRCRRRCCGHR